MNASHAAKRDAIRAAIIDLASELTGGDDDAADDGDNEADELYGNLAVALWAIDDKMTYGRSGPATGEQAAHLLDALVDEDEARHMAAPIDRPHRFAEGDVVRHVDSEPGTAALAVTALTWRERDGRLYPTYTLEDPTTGETAADVLCTDDLAAV